MIITLIVRVAIIAFSAVVLGLSIVLLRQQVYGRTPPQTGYAAFSGAWGILFGLLGCISPFIEAVPTVIMIGIDALSAIILLVGGVVLSVGMRGINCSRDVTALGGVVGSPILNGGVRQSGGQTFVGYYQDKSSEDEAFDFIVGKCMRARAANVFQYLGMVAFIAGIFVTFWSMKRGGASNLGRKTYV